MRENSEFLLNEIVASRYEIEYIKVYDTVYKKYKYSDLIIKLIATAIDTNNTKNLLLGRIIYINNNKKKGTYEYKGFYFTIPSRKAAQLDRVKRIIELCGLDANEVKIKFIGDYEELQEVFSSKLTEDSMKQLKKDASIEINKKQVLIEEFKNKVKHRTDDELVDILDKQYYEEESITFREYCEKLDNLENFRKQLEWFDNYKVYEHLKFITNDRKQAELYGVSLRKYREQYKEKELNSDSLYRAFKDYVESINKTDKDTEEFIDFGLFEQHM